MATKTDILLVSEVGDLDIEAAAAEGEPKKLRKFSMTAYTGGAMRLPGYSYPVVVDLSGMTVNTQSRPILMGHDHAQIVGHTERVDVAAKSIKVAGVISGIGDAARQVVELADNRFPWQASIGAAVDVQPEYVAAGSTVRVNGRSFAGPVYVARKTTLREVSFVALGADDHASATVAASLTESETMGFEAWLAAKGFDASSLSDDQQGVLRAAYDAEQQPAEPPVEPQPVQASAQDDIHAYRAAVAAEAARVADIRAICAQYNGPTVDVNGQKVSLEVHAIQAGWDRNQTELSAMKASRPAAPAIHSGTADVSSRVLEAAVCRAGKLSNLEASYDAQTLEAVDRMYGQRGIGLQELLLEAAYRNGFVGRPKAIQTETRSVLQAAFTTHEVSGILSNIANKFLLASFNSIESTWRRIAKVSSVSDFKTVTRYRLTGDAVFEQVGADGQLKHGTMDEESFTISAKTYGKIFGITREHLINDDLNAISEELPRRLGRGAALKLNKVFWTAFLANSTFFTADNGNYQEGATTALSIDALTAAELLFLDQTDPDGDPLSISPRTLLVPNALSVTASQLMTALEVRDTNSNKQYMTRNPHAGKYEVVRSSYLTDSTTAWYLLADPNDLPVIEVAFLNGQETPVVEHADADFDQLGIQMRGYFDFGVGLQDYRGGVKSKGAA